MNGQHRSSGCVLLALAAACALAGCKVGPDYRKPKVMTPTTYASTQPATQPAAVVELTRWWESLGDPQLSDLIARATAANLDLKVAQSRVREARAARGISAAAGQPQVNANGAYARSHQSENVAGTGFGSEDSDLYRAGFDASWELDVFGGAKRAVEAADAAIVSSIEGQRDVLTTLQAEVATNYVQLRTQQRRLVVARDAVRVQQESAALARLRRDAGIANDLDVAQAEAQVATTLSQIPQLEMQILTTMHRLGVLLGGWPADLIAELTAEKPIPVPVPDIPAGQPGELLRRRPDVRRAEANLMAATANVGAATAELYPKFSLLGNAGLQSSTFTNWWQADSRFWNIGPQVSWSILNGGQVRSAIEVENARQEQALLVYQRTILLGVQEVEDSLTQYAQEQRRRVQLQDAVTANERTLTLARAQFEQGLRDFTAVLDAQRALYATQDLLVQSEGNVTVNAISAYKALGGGWVLPTPTTRPVTK